MTSNCFNQIAQIHSEPFRLVGGPRSTSAQRIATWTEALAEWERQRAHSTDLIVFPSAIALFT